MKKRLTSEFRGWWNGDKILKLAEGDSRLIVSLFKKASDFSVGVFEKTESDYQPEKFRLLELAEKMDFTQANMKFDEIKKEF